MMPRGFQAVGDQHRLAAYVGAAILACTAASADVPYAVVFSRAFSFPRAFASSSVLVPFLASAFFRAVALLIALATDLAGTYTVILALAVAVADGRMPARNRAAALARIALEGLSAAFCRSVRTGRRCSCVRGMPLPACSHDGSRSDPCLTPSHLAEQGFSGMA